MSEPSKGWGDRGQKKAKKWQPPKGRLVTSRGSTPRTFFKGTKEEFKEFREQGKHPHWNRPNPFWRHLPKPPTSKPFKWVSEKGPTAPTRTYFRFKQLNFNNDRAFLPLTMDDNKYGHTETGKRKRQEEESLNQSSNKQFTEATNRVIAGLAPKSFFLSNPPLEGYFSERYPTIPADWFDLLKTYIVSGKPAFETKMLAPLPNEHELPPHIQAERKKPITFFLGVPVGNSLDEIKKLWEATDYKLNTYGILNLSTPTLLGDASGPPPIRDTDYHGHTIETSHPSTFEGDLRTAFKAEGYLPTGLTNHMDILTSAFQSAMQQGFPISTQFQEDVATLCPHVLEIYYTLSNTIQEFKKSDFNIELLEADNIWNAINFMIDDCATYARKATTASGFSYDHMDNIPHDSLYYKWPVKNSLQLFNEIVSLINYIGWNNWEKCNNILQKYLPQQVKRLYPQDNNNCLLLRHLLLFSSTKPIPMSETEHNLTEDLIEDLAISAYTLTGRNMEEDLQHNKDIYDHLLASLKTRYESKQQQGAQLRFSFLKTIAQQHSISSCNNCNLVIQKTKPWAFMRNFLEKNPSLMFDAIIAASNVLISLQENPMTPSAIQTISTSYPRPTLPEIATYHLAEESSKNFDNTAEELHLDKSLTRSAKGHEQYIQDYNTRDESWAFYATLRAFASARAELLHPRTIAKIEEDGPVIYDFETGQYNLY